MTEDTKQPVIAVDVGSTLLLGGVINVTHDEFAEIHRIMRGEPGCDVAEAKAVCQMLGLELDAMAFKLWTIKVVDEVKQRCEPPNPQAERPAEKETRDES